MDASAVRDHAGDLPRQPGVYYFLAGAAETPLPEAQLDPEQGPLLRGDPTRGEVLYIGKALDLRDRVASYVDPRSERIRQMLASADSIDVAVTDTETQALLLEANLIKRHRPRYNVRLTDDKSYPLVQLTDHPAPRIEITRDPDPGATVYGPFTDVGRLETVLKAVRELFGLRGCSDHKYRDRDRPCLDYEMGLCSAPCTGEIERSVYAADVDAVERFFGGETGVLAEPLEAAMREAAATRRYERAAHLRDRLGAVDSFHETGGAAVSDAQEEGRHVDVLGVSLEGDKATVARLHATDGKLVDRDHHALALPAGATDVPAVLAAFVTQFYAERELPDAILCQERPAREGLGDWLDAAGVDLRVPGAGRDATLVDLAMKNARRGDRTESGVAALVDALSIDRADRIEGFDVSHAGGRDVVGSDVCFVDGSARTTDYRRKKLQETNDDVANMRALIRWRAQRAVEGRDDRPDPDLLLIDGGEAQLEAAETALEGAGWDLEAVGLAKAEERVITPEGSFDWPADDPALQLLQRVRDEAHRFARQYHETLRDDVSTVLEEIHGVGPTTRTRLLRRFGSVETVRSASVAELQSVEGIGEATARTLEERL
jgi:excinuclease ABC subunit C